MDEGSRSHLTVGRDDWRSRRYRWDFPVEEYLQAPEGCNFLEPGLGPADARVSITVITVVAIVGQRKGWVDFSWNQKRRGGSMTIADEAFNPIGSAVDLVDSLTCPMVWLPEMVCGSGSL